MIDKKTIIAIAKHAFKRSQGIPDKKLMHPQRDWAIGLLLFVAISTFGGSAGAVLYDQYQSIDPTANGDAGARVPKYQDSLVDTQIEAFRAKEQTYNAYVMDRLTPEMVEEVATSTATSTESVATSTESGVVDLATTTITSETEIIVVDEIGE